MATTIANYVRTTSNGSNWYSVNIADCSADVMEYFQDRAMREPDFTIISDETISWCTQFLCEDKYAISTGISKNGKVFLKTEAILSAEDRRKAMQAKKATQPKSVSKTAVDSIDVEL